MQALIEMEDVTRHYRMGDETVVALGVIHLLCGDADPELQELAVRATAILQERVQSAGEGDVGLSLVRDGS